MGLAAGREALVPGGGPSPTTLLVPLFPTPRPGALSPHSPPSVDSQLLRLGERVRSSAPGPW